MVATKIYQYLEYCHKRRNVETMGFFLWFLHSNNLLDRAIKQIKKKIKLDDDIRILEVIRLHEYAYGNYLMELFNDRDIKNKWLNVYRQCARYMSHNAFRKSRKCYIDILKESNKILTVRTLKINMANAQYHF